jgi:hypothetical protein
VEIFNETSADNTQAGGAVDIELKAADRFCYHQVQAQVSATASAGTLDVAIRSPGATDFVSVGTITLTGSELLKTFGPAFVAEMRFTPSGFDADKTFDVIVTSGK